MFKKKSDKIKCRSIKKWGEIMLQILKEHLGFYRQIIKLSVNELIKEYKGAALGPLWAVLKPAFLIFVYWFAFAFGLRHAHKISGHSFVLWLIIGSIPWFYISDAIRDGAGSLRSNRHLITKMPFPRSTVMTFVCLARLYGHIFLLLLGVVILLLNGYKPSIYWLQIFFYLPLMYLYFTVLAWITAPLSALSKDFHNLIKSVISGLFWLSGIVYDSYSMHAGLVKSIVLANPITYFVNGYRNTFIYHRWFFDTRYETGMFFLILAITAVIGSIIFNRVKDDLPDVL